MPVLHSDDKKVTLELELLVNEYLDIEDSRSDYENWIPFSFILSVEKEIYAYPAEKGAAFSLYELKNLIFRLENLIKSKQKGYEAETYDFHSSEAYFSMLVYDPFEKDEISIDLWINMGSLTDGVIHGYEKGVRFTVMSDSMTVFVNELKEQLRQYDIGKNGIEKIFSDFGKYETRRRNETRKREENLEAITIIKKMLKDRLHTDLIRKYTGLTKEQIDKIDL